MSVLICPHCGAEFEGPGKRSTRACRYWFGAIVKRFQEIWSRGRTQLNLPPYTKNQVHYTLVSVLAGEEPGPMGKPVPVETHIMDSREFWQLTEDARALAWDEYQSYIKTPEEWRQDGEAA